MKVGDLVKYIDHSGYQEWKEIGIILRDIPGTHRLKVVRWSTGTQTSYPVTDLEVISEGG